jgi:hypothetical protein
MKAKLAGYVHLARMIDKCRAVLAGTAGDYVYPCSLDKRFLNFTGLTSDQLLEAVQKGSDEEVVEWLRHTALPHRNDEIESWNQMMLTCGPDTEEKWAYFRSCLEKVLPGRTDITNWADIFDLEERRAGPTLATTGLEGTG